MTEYDAFGRKIGEDTLEGLGTGSDEAVAAETAEAEAETSPAEPAVSAMSAGSSLGADHVSVPHTHTATSTMPEWAPGKRRFLGPLIALVVLGGVGLAVFSLVETGREVVGVVDAVDEALDQVGEAPSIPDIPGVPDPDVPSRPAADGPGPAPKGLEGDSLIRRTRFAAALRALRREAGGRAVSLSIRPERIDLQMVSGSGRMRVMQITPGPQVRTVVTTEGFSGISTMSLRGVDAGAPERLARASARQLKLPTSRVDYVVLTNGTGTPAWVVYFENGRYVVGDGAGNVVRAYP